MKIPALPPGASTVMEGDRQCTGKQVNLTGTQVVVGVQEENWGGEGGGGGPFTHLSTDSTCSRPDSQKSPSSQASLLNSIQDPATACALSPVLLIFATLWKTYCFRPLLQTYKLRLKYYPRSSPSPPFHLRPEVGQHTDS